MIMQLIKTSNILCFKQNIIIIKQKSQIKMKYTIAIAALLGLISAEHAITGVTMLDDVKNATTALHQKNEDSSSDAQDDDGSSSDAQEDSSSDAQADSSTDLQEEPAKNATALAQEDSSSDAQADSSTDAQADSSSDAQADSSSDAQADSSSDAQADSSTDWVLGLSKKHNSSLII